MNLNKEELRSAIIGMVIGDGCISMRQNRSEAYFQLSHCERQYDYMLWKQEILDNITSSKITPTCKIMNNKEYRGYHLGTNQHPFFTKLYSRFYHNGHKVVDEYLVKKINELALAIWFMDDGCVGHDKNRKESEVSYFLATDNFDYANQLLLKKSLKLNFGLDWNMNKANKSKDGTYNYRLRLARRHNADFVNIVSSLMIPCMKYKLGSHANQEYNSCDTV